jgi:hypothetical protein
MILNYVAESMNSQDGFVTQPPTSLHEQFVVSYEVRREQSSAGADFLRGFLSIYPPSLLAIDVNILGIYRTTINTFSERFLSRISKLTETC